MTELEADDALASAARIASEDQRVQKICIWTPDKDLAQCVRGDRVVQIDRRGKKIRDAEGVREKFGVEPTLIPDFLALVGDAADGYPGIAGDRRDNGGAAFEPSRHDRRVSARRCSGTVATSRSCSSVSQRLRDDAPLFRNVDELRWRGPTDAFAAWTERMGAPRLLERCIEAQQALTKKRAGDPALFD